MCFPEDTVNNVKAPIEVPMFQVWNLAWPVVSSTVFLLVHKQISSTISAAAKLQLKCLAEPWYDAVHCLQNPSCNPLHLRRLPFNGIQTFVLEVFIGQVLKMLVFFPPWKLNHRIMMMTCIFLFDYYFFNPDLLLITAPKSCHCQFLVYYTKTWYITQAKSDQSFFPSPEQV